MGLFDLFKKQDSDKSNSLAKPLQHSNDLIENTEFMLEEVNIDLTKADAIELPFAQLSALGGSIASMLPSLRTISNKVTVENKGLYQAVFPDGIEGQLAKKDGMNLGTIMNKHGIVGQVRWKKQILKLSQRPRLLRLTPPRLQWRQRFPPLTRNLMKY